MGSGANNSGDDIFTSFLSAPPAAEAPPASVASVAEDGGLGKRSAEEDSFFNQPSANSLDKKPLTKDSIMALYAQGGSQQAPQQPVFGIPGV